jgi:predicted aspartyl protease
MNTTELNTKNATKITLRNPLELQKSASVVVMDTLIEEGSSRLLLPATAEMLNLPILRKQALHEAVQNVSSERKTVHAVEMEINGTRAVVEATIEPTLTKAVVGTSVLRELAIIANN